jgi:hypothetical protein
MQDQNQRKRVIKMRFAIIKVRDNDGGHEHILGTNSHDTLHIDDETGGLHYQNLQCCEGTTKYDGRSTYEFVGQTDEYNPYAEIEFVSFEELLEIYKENIAMSCEQERATRDMFKVFIEHHRKENNLDEDEGEIRHTGGDSRY